MEKLIKTLNSFTPISEQSLELITPCFIHKSIPKGTIVVKEQQTARYFYWLIKGIMRGRINPKGEYITTWFATENMFCSSMPSFISRKPSMESIEVLEDCEVYCISRQDVLRLFKQTTEMSSIVRQMAEEAYIQALNRTYQFQYLSAKERYDSFVAHYPKLMQKIPLGMIASYIGITQQSLSRIRRAG